MIKKLLLSASSIVVICLTCSAFADKPHIRPFPMDKYDQNISNWIDPLAPDYNKPIIAKEMQKKQTKEFYNHTFAVGKNAQSPWAYNYVNNELAEKLVYFISKQQLRERYGNEYNTAPDKAPYAEDYRPMPDEWLSTMIDKMDLGQFKQPVKYQAKNRAIAIDNLFGRSLPTHQGLFTLYIGTPGDQHPFDWLQDSSIWAGTPLYIIGQSKNKQWSLVLTPSYITWVETNKIARVNKKFVKKWGEHAKKHMAAITKVDTPINDLNNDLRFSGYMGAFFPVKKINKDSINILIPIADRHHNADITEAKVSKEIATVMPLKATPHNFVNILSEMIGKLYGWGGLRFNNDCSSELQNLYAPFGIWLQRNSTGQMRSREIVDLQDKTTDERIDYLMKNGKKFITLANIAGHVMIYMGTYPNPNSTAHEPMVLTYQNVWANLKPEDQSYRAIIGRAVLLPMLKQYPEDPRIVSLAGQKHFRVFDLDKTMMPQQPVIKKDTKN